MVISYWYKHSCYGDEMKKYQIIYADPPWRYRDKNCNGACAAHYKTMSLKDISSLSIDAISDNDCVLFLWATYPLYPEALEVIKHWGFKYKSIAFQWVKLNKKNLKPFYGLGRWTRGNTEPCLIAAKGKPKRISKSVFQLVFSPIRGHSQKPDIVKSKIIELLGDLPRIELFAREKTEGWDVWGNEVESDIELRSNPNEL